MLCTNEYKWLWFYTIANMVSILNGIDPSGITYTVSKIRDHLIKGFENQNITVYYQLCFIIDIICDLFIARND